MIQTHATKSNLPMKLSSHAKKNPKEKKGTMEIFWLWHCQQYHCHKERKGERDEAGTNGATRNKYRNRDLIVHSWNDETDRKIERSKWRKKEQRLWEKEQHEREKINPIFPNSRHLHEWFKPMLQNQIYPWNYQAMPKKIQRKKRDNGDILALTLSAVLLSQRERMRKRWSWDQQCDREQR